MLNLVTRDNAHLYAIALRQMYELRHHVFVETYGHDTGRFPDGLERDQFDNSDAMYLLMLGPDRQTVIGAHRILKTTRPHMLSDVFSHLCTRGVDRGPHVFEVSRCCLDERLIHPINLDYVRAAFFTALTEFLVKAKATCVTAIAPMELLAHTLRDAPRLRPLGPPADFDGRLYVPVSLKLSSGQVEADKLRLGLCGPLVRYAGPRGVSAPGVLGGYQPNIHTLH